jgi:hypothetical protein
MDYDVDVNTKEIVLGGGGLRYGYGYCEVAGSCEQGNEISGYMKGQKFI